MLNDLNPAAGHDRGRPLPYDTVTLRPSNTAGVDPTTPYTIADFLPAAGVDAYEVNHPDTHPDYWDWAATVHLDDIATITRHTATGPATWRPAP